MGLKTVAPPARGALRSFGPNDRNFNDMNQIPLTLQTTYADLLDKLQDAEIVARTREPGSFFSRKIKERVYWYRQYHGTDGRRHKSYVGPETPDLLARIDGHKEMVAAEEARRSLVRSLTRSRALPAPPPAVGQVLAALADAGVFRLRAVLVGTVAYQAYAGMLGVRLPGATTMTEDIDIAQFRSISLAIAEDEQLPPMLDTLRQVDRSFEPIPRLDHAAQPDAYRTRGGSNLKVEFLTPMRGAPRSGTSALHALNTAGQLLRFLDYLIYQERKAAILYGPGILVNVPDPARFAWHKLILSQRREDRQKVSKDIMQAQHLMQVLVRDYPGDLKDMWTELEGDERKKWQDLARQGLDRMPSASVRESVRNLIGTP